MRKVVFEVIFILLISLFLSLVYNAVSPTGLRILPKKKETSAQLSLRAERGPVPSIARELI